jgi:hypothetical protein
MSNVEFVKEYKYIVFKDEIGEIFTIRDLQLDTFLVSGTYIGKLIELERGIFEQPKENESYIGMLINKKKEWLLKLAEEQIKQNKDNYIDESKVLVNNYVSGDYTYNVYDYTKNSKLTIIIETLNNITQQIEKSVECLTDAMAMSYLNLQLHH